MVAIWFGQTKNFVGTKKIRKKLIHELKFLSSNIERVIKTNENFCKTAARTLKDHKHIFLLGSGLGEICAKEGALKIKELTYMHCQALATHNIGNSFFSYIKNHKDTCTFVIALDDESLKDTLT